MTRVPKIFFPLASVFTFISVLLLIPKVLQVPHLYMYFFKITFRDIERDTNIIWLQGITFRESNLKEEIKADIWFFRIDQKTVLKTPFQLSHFFAANRRAVSKFNFVCTYCNE